MKLRPKTAISEFFSDIEDPRVERQKRHKLIDIITITKSIIKVDSLRVDHKGKVKFEQRYFFKKLG